MQGRSTQPRSRRCTDRRFAPTGCVALPHIPPPRLATVVALAYAPVLLFLLILVVVGLVFTFWGGFLIVLSGLYFMLVELIGVVGLAARARRRARNKGRPARDRVVPGPITYRSPPRRVGGLGAMAMTAVPRPEEVFARRPSLNCVAADVLGGNPIVDARRPPPDSGPVT